MIQKKTQVKAMVFTVADSDNGGKPTVWVQTASDVHAKDQEACEKLVSEYVSGDWPGKGSKLNRSVQDIAYTLRNRGFCWVNDRFCFELSEVWG